MLIFVSDCYLANISSEKKTLWYKTCLKARKSFISIHLQTFTDDRKICVMNTCSKEHTVSTPLLLVFSVSMSYTKTNQSKRTRPLSYRKRNQMPTAIRQMNQYSNSNFLNGFNG